MAHVDKEIMELECSLPYSQEPATEHSLRLIYKINEITRYFLKACLNFMRSKFYFNKVPS
jgi:hypothetical protein